MWAICLRAVFAFGHHWYAQHVRCATLPVLTPHPTLPRTFTHHAQTQACKKKCGKFSYLDGEDRLGWWAAQGGGERGRKHKEKAWLVCEFSTCNLSYSELSCSLLFGSNRLMPGVRLNKSTMHSSGWNTLSFTFPLLLFLIPLLFKNSPSWRRRGQLFPFDFFSVALFILLFSPFFYSYLLFPLQPFHLLISSSNLLLESTFNPSFCSCSPASYVLLSYDLYQTDRTPPVGSQELVKSPIRNSENQQVGLLATAPHGRDDPSLHLASFYFLPFLSAAFQRCTFTPPLTTPRGDVHQKPRGTGQMQGWIGNGLDGKQSWTDKLKHAKCCKEDVDTCPKHHWMRLYVL